MEKLIFSSLLLIVMIIGCEEKIKQPREVSFYIQKTEDTTYYHIASNSFAPIEISAWLRNDEFNAIYVKGGLVQPKDTLFNVIKISNALHDKLGQSKLLSEYVGSKFDYGDSKTAKHNTNYLYSLPIETGKSVRISQGFNGKSSHTAVHSKYAIDFDIPVGTPIYAAREGTVVYAINQFKKSGGISYLKKANKIIILHNDGTFAAYSHLMHNGALVKKGDSVKRGQHIGYSGNTGFTRGPHLHFAVRLPKDICVPIYFKGYEGIVFKKGDHVKRLK